MSTEQTIYQWMEENKPGEKLGYKSQQAQQIYFVRDHLLKLFTNDYDEHNRLKEEGLKVISKYFSRSVLLPVLKIELPDSTFFVLRCNYYDWKVSISSPKGIYIDPKGFFVPESQHSSVSCEGFPDELVFGSYSTNQKQFTIALSSSNYELYTFFHMFARCWKANK